MMRKFVTYFAVVSNLALVDAIVKEWAIARLKGGAWMEVAPFFNLAYVENRGCAWGMLQNHVWPLAAVGIIAIAVVIWKRRRIFDFSTMAVGAKVRSCLAFWAEALLYAGIFGNLLDRIYRGYVVDMFDFHLGKSHFPCFNVADAYITLAVVILFAAAFFTKRPRESEQAAIKNASPGTRKS